MKQQLAAIAFNERELESYVSQLKSGGFETLSDVKRADDGSFYQVLAKASKHEGTTPPKPVAAEGFPSPQP